MTNPETAKFSAVALRLNQYHPCDSYIGSLIQSGGITIAIKYIDSVQGRRMAIAALIDSLWLSDLDLDKVESIDEAIDQANIMAFNKGVELTPEELKSGNSHFTSTSPNEQGLTNQPNLIVGANQFFSNCFSLFPSEAEIFGSDIYDLVLSADSSKIPSILRNDLNIDATQEKYIQKCITHLDDAVLSGLKIKNYVESLIQSDNFFADQCNCILTGNSF